MAQPATPPDVVRLHDGTFLRGTIVERSPTQVVIMLLTGETRTYPAAEVEFAGPDVAPAPAPPIIVESPRQPIMAPLPPQPPPVPMATLHVRSAQQGLSLQRLQGTASVAVAISGGGAGYAQIDQFGIICNAPCDIELPAGTYQLGVAPGAGSALRAGPPMNLSGDMSLELSYDDRSVLRIMGYLALGLGFGGGAALVMAGLFANDYYTDAGMIVSGSVIGGASFIAFWVLAFLQDAPRIDFDPVVRF